MPKIGDGIVNPCHMQYGLEYLVLPQDWWHMATDILESLVLQVPIDGILKYLQIQRMVSVLHLLQMVGTYRSNRGK